MINTCQINFLSSSDTLQLVSLERHTLYLNIHWILFSFYWHRIPRHSHLGIFQCRDVLSLYVIEFVTFLTVSSLGLDQYRNRTEKKDFIRMDWLLHRREVLRSNLHASKAFYSVVNISYVDLLETDAKENVQESISLNSLSFIDEFPITNFPTWTRSSYSHWNICVCMFFFIGSFVLIRHHMYPTGMMRITLNQQRSSYGRKWT